MRQIMKRLYYQNYCIDHNQNLQNNRDPRLLSMGGPNMPPQKSKMAAVAILENQKMQYLYNGLTSFDEFGRVMRVSPLVPDSQ